MLCLAVTASVLVLDREHLDASVRSSAAGAGAGVEAAGPAGVSTLLARLAAALEHGPTAQVAELGAPGGAGARRQLVTMRANVRSLHISDLTLRYVSGRPVHRAGERRAAGPVTWVATVRLGWRLRGVDAHPALREVPVTVRTSASGARFVTARGRDGKGVPLWLLTRVRVDRTARAVVVAAASVPQTRVARIAALADRAVVELRRVLPRWHGRLAVEVPGGAPQLEAVLGSAPGAYDRIAAATTTADGSLSADRPVRIFVNSGVFGRLGPRGSQIVMTHEATHVATGAAVSSMPPWLLEGFADYVALAAEHVPVRVSASQAIARVRRAGVPAHLPDRADFDPGSSAIGASYEAAWLACRQLARTYGQRRLVAFYRTVDRTSSTGRAFRALGTDRQAFTRAWQRELRRLAR